ncbi:MAG: hypothetical protein Q8910_00915 [Bacteroidota bacterium]|nr:hypothetical protein [Bacteroidota bacterium]
MEVAPTRLPDIENNPVQVALKDEVLEIAPEIILHIGEDIEEIAMIEPVLENDPVIVGGPMVLTAAIIPFILKDPLMFVGVITPVAFMLPTSGKDPVILVII